MAPKDHYCQDCGEAEPCAFYKGCKGRCKVCTARRVRENRQANLEYYQAYDRVRYNEHGHRGHPSKEAASRAKRKWYKENKHKQRAQLRLRRAVAGGKVAFGDSCSSCGATNVKLQAHHEDYTKPLDVRWLCTACHGWEHRRYDPEEDRKFVDANKNWAKAV